MATKIVFNNTLFDKPAIKTWVSDMRKIFGGKHEMIVKENKNILFIYDYEVELADLAQLYNDYGFAINSIKVNYNIFSR